MYATTLRNFRTTSRKQRVPVGVKAECASSRGPRPRCLIVHICLFCPSLHSCVGHRGYEGGIGFLKVLQSIRTSVVAHTQLSPPTTVDTACLPTSLFLLFLSPETRVPHCCITPSRSTCFFPLILIRFPYLSLGLFLLHSLNSS